MHWKDTKRFAKLPSWLGKQVAGTIVGLLVAAFVGWLLAFSGFTRTSGGHRSRPPLADQIDTLRSSLARSGFEINTFQEVTLRPGIPSLLLTTTRGLHTHDVEIYDYINGELKRAFRFAASVAVKPDAGIKESTEGIETPESSPFSAEDITTIDDAGPDRGVFGSFDDSVEGATRRIPAVITWSATTREYIVSPLLLKPTVFAPYTDTDSQTAAIRELAYNTPRMAYTIADSYTATSFTGYALTSYIIVQSADEAVQYLLGSVVVDQSQSPVADIMEVNLWQVEQEDDIIAAGPCMEAAPQHLPAYFTAPLRADDNHTLDLKAIWTEISSRLTSLSCLDVLVERGEMQEESPPA